MSTQILPNPLTAPTVGTSPVQVIAANPSRNGLFVYNPSATVTLAICPVGATPAINGQGTITLTPGLGITLGNDFPFTAGLMAIASSGATNPITVWEF